VKELICVCAEPRLMNYLVLNLGFPQVLKAQREEFKNMLMNGRNHSESPHAPRRSSNSFFEMNRIRLAAALFTILILLGMSIPVKAKARRKYSQYL